MADEADMAQSSSDFHTRLAIGTITGRGALESRCFCTDCEEPIPEARRVAVPGCARCIACQRIHEGA